MTRQTVDIARQPDLMRGVLAQCVENHALLRIFRSYFNDWTTMYPSDHDGIVKKRLRGLCGLIRSAWKLVFEKTTNCDWMARRERQAPIASGLWTVKLMNSPTGYFD